ncbi:hypothetical protein GQ105_003395 [Salmonella enterica]|nr:hypothetical protein [Salmonella enterica]
MKIKFIDEKNFSKYVYKRFSMPIEIEFSEKSLSKNKQEIYRQLNHNDLINFLNDNSKNSFPEINKTVPIVLYDFTTWSNFKIRLNLFYHLKHYNALIKPIFTSYQPSIESICISISLYEDNKKENEVNEHEVYKFLLASDCSHEETTNLVLLHEIGHAIHHQLEKHNGYLLEPTTPEASFLNPFVSFNEECVEKIPTVTAIAYKAITEGFADLYSCIIVDRLYDSSRSDVIINALYQYRTSHKSENYYSYPSIESYMSQRNGRDFNNFDEIYKYMSSTIAHTTVKNMGVKLLDGSEELGRFIGVVNKLQGLNYSKIDKAVESIRSNYPFIDYVIFYVEKKNPFSYHQNLFEEGCKAGEKWLKKRAKRKFKNKIKDIKRSVSIKDSESMQGNADKHKPK